jgi:heme-degrading monooxygenase HmoA
VAIMMMFEAKGADEARYDATNEHLGIAGDDDAPDGLVSHVAGLTDDGLLIVDVWESKEKLEAFVHERLEPALAAAGIEGDEPTILPVHAMIPQGAGTTAGTIVILDMNGFGPDTYDAMAARMDAHTAADGSDHPAVSHAAGITDDGMVIVDVWESPEAFGAFAESQIGPAGAATGLDPAAVQPRFVPAVNRIRGNVSVSA